jgi:very-short-patch-repair endonuclease
MLEFLHGDVEEGFFVWEGVCKWGIGIKKTTSPYRGLLLEERRRKKPPPPGGDSSLKKEEKKMGVEIDVLIVCTVIFLILLYRFSSLFEGGIIHYRVNKGKAGIMKQQMNNLPHLKHFRKNLRNNSTSAEATLWLSLKSRQLDGRKFRRQHSIENYILDFYCPSEKINIELDGQGHYTEEGKENDSVRDAFLNQFGVKVIRVENREVFENLENVLEMIRGNFKR